MGTRRFAGNFCRKASRRMGERHYGEERRESAEDKAEPLVEAGLRKAAGKPIWRRAARAIR
jgi:hypothetical protein